MRIFEEYDYRNAKAILEKRFPNVLKEIYHILEDPKNELNFKTKGKLRDFSVQIKTFFTNKGWQEEVGVFSAPELKYDLVKEKIPVEVEIGHQRLVYAVFFKYLIDYSKKKIPAGIMIVTGNPEKYVQKWHNSIKSTKKKLEAVENTYLVPILVIGVDP